jgi:hypothetical protein
MSEDKKPSSIVSVESDKTEKVFKLGEVSDPSLAQDLERFRRDSSKITVKGVIRRKASP